MGLFDDIVRSVTHPDPESLPSGSVSPVQAGGLTVPRGAMESVANSVSNWLGHGADASNPVTAETANQHAAAAQPDSLWGSIGQGIGDFGRGLSQEGIGGILDPGGMLDRQQAQRDLAGRFQVMPDGSTGPHKDNQVSQEEFQNIARTFSDVRRGQGDLKVDASSFDGKDSATQAADYKQGAMDQIANMMMTNSGRKQINNLNDNVLEDDNGDARTTWYGADQHHTTTIKPLFGVDNGKRDKKGAIVWEDPGAGKHTNSTLRSDNGFAAPKDSAASDRNADGSRGDGSDVDIKWNPGANNIGGQGARSDIILAHEMQHAINQSQGSMALGQYGIDPKTGLPLPGNVGESDVGQNNRERQAVGLTRTDTATGGHYPGDPDGCTENTYRQERNDLGLGEKWLPRTAYSGLPGQAADDATNKAAWDAHNASGKAAP